MARPRRVQELPKDIKSGTMIPNPCEYNGCEILIEPCGGNYRIVISRNGLYVMCVQVDDMEYGITKAKEYIDGSK